MELNEEIRDAEVRLVGPNGDQLGIFSAKDAFEKALEANLDLVKIAPKAKPPVCKIMDYGKFKYEQAKKEKEAKKNQKIINVKEVRLSPNIEEHDLNIKANQARKFLGNEDKVKVSLRFKGREMKNTDKGKIIMNKFIELLSDDCKIEKKPSLEGRQMIMFLVPKKD